MVNAMIFSDLSINGALFNLLSKMQVSNMRFPSSHEYQSEPILDVKSHK